MSFEPGATEHGECCQSSQMKDGRCKLVPPRPPRFIISGTKYQANHEHQDRLCDYVICWCDESGEETIAAVELKAGNVPLTSIRQLANGARLAEVLYDPHGKDFIALLVTREGLHALDQRVLAKARVRFNGSEYPILRASCGDQLALIVARLKGT